MNEHMIQMKAMTHLLNTKHIPRENLEEAFVTTLFTLMQGNERKVLTAITALELLSKGEM
jgi:hypothetical protein